MLEVEPLYCNELPMELAEKWDDLETVSFGPSFQLEFNYITAWIDWIKGDWNLLILLIKDDSKILGIFPLMYKDELRKHIVPFRRIRFLASTMSDFSNILAGPDKIKIVVDKALQWITKNDFRWELLILDDIMEGNPLIEELKSWLAQNNIFFEIQEGRYYYIDLERTWDQIWADTNNKFIRRSVNLARNRLNKAGKWGLLKNPDWTVEDIISKAEIIHSKRQTELSRKSFFSDASYRSFIKKVLDINRSNNRLSSYWLELNDDLIAYLIGFEIQRVFYAWNMAFLPEYDRFFPSKFLFSEIIRDCNQRNLKEFNFMRGEADYKPKWTSTFRKNYRFVIKNSKTIYGNLMIIFDKLKSK